MMANLKTILLLNIFTFNSLHTFKVPPKDRVFYAKKTGQQLLQICVPRDINNEVEWRRGNETLKDNDRVSIFRSKNVKKYISKPTNIERVNVLEINDITSRDQGIYSCIDSQTRQEIDFRIDVVESCKKPYFKCKSNDRKCIPYDAMCDGERDCEDYSDETEETGCFLPTPPTNLRVIAKTWDRVKFTWDSVKHAIRYEIKNNFDESIIVPAYENTTIFDELRPGRKYTFSIRTKSFSGESAYSDGIDVKTTPLMTLDPPTAFDGLDFEGVGLLVTWMPVTDAIGYQVFIRYPDGTNRTTDVTTTHFTLRKTAPRAIYMFRVRQWNGFQYGRLSDKLYVKTLPKSDIDDDGGFNMTVDQNQTLTLKWDYSTKLPSVSGIKRRNTRFYELKYVLNICQMRPVYFKWTTNETLVSDVHILNWINKTDNSVTNIRKTYKNYTIHYDKLHQRFMYYENFSCEDNERVSDIDELKYEVDGLIIKQNYSYNVQLYFDDQLIAELFSGNFTAPKYVVYVPIEKPSIFHGVVTYGIACGILIVMLMVSFLLAWVCKWNLLMADVAMKKARVNNEQEQAKADKVRPQLLTESYINDRTNPNNPMDPSNEKTKLTFAA